MSFALKRFLYKFIILFVISLIFIIFTRLYSNHIASESERTIKEHARILTEPLWNFDEDMINNFLSTVIVKKEYQAIRIYTGDSLLSKQVHSSQGGSFEKWLQQIAFIKIVTLNENISKNDTVLGRIEIDWKDSTSYMISYAFLVGVLFYVIFLMYSRILNTNQYLEKNNQDLQDAVKEIQKQNDYIEQIFNVVPQGLITLDNELQLSVSNDSYQSIVIRWAELLKMDVEDLQMIFINRLKEEIQHANSGVYVMTFDKHTISLKYFAVQLVNVDNNDSVVSLEDISEFATLQRRVTQAEKLEAVGRLAAGIAHEINTPIQYVMSNVDFLAESTEEMKVIMDEIGTLGSESGSTIISNILDSILKKFNDIEWDFLGEEIPEALQQTKEGLRRIESIVRAMKQFSHPAGDTAELCNINEGISATTMVAQNEWKYIADMDLALDPELPAIHCFLDQLNQVMLLMIVNAAHAIEERSDLKEDQKGTISIATKSKEDTVEIIISDTGCGMNDEVKERIFDPFYTTKEVGKGSGQGLSIAHDIIIKQHKGTIEVTSEPGIGTTFIIGLPRN